MHYILHANYQSPPVHHHLPISTCRLAASDCSNVQGWLVDGGDEEVDEIIPSLTLRMIGDAAGADEFLQPRRSRRLASSSDVREIDDDSESDDEPVCEDTCFEDLGVDATD